MKIRTIFASMIAIFQFNAQCVNAFENRTFIYTYDTINQNCKIEDIQQSNIYCAKDELTSQIEKAFSEMCDVKLTGYQKHLALNNNEQKTIFELYSLMKEEGNCGFDALSLDRKTTSDLIIHAFSNESWSRYTKTQKSELNLLLKNMLTTWMHDFGISIAAMNSVIDGQEYSPAEYHNILRDSIDTFVKENRKQDSYISDLDDNYINLISYILGIRIIAATEHWIYEPLKNVLPNASLNKNNGFILLYNTGSHWLRWVANKELSTALPRDENSYTSFVGEYNIATLTVPGKFDIVNVEGIGPMKFPHNEN